MDTQLGDRILDALKRREPSAALVLEVAAALRPAPNPVQVDAALSQLADQGKALVIEHAAPDVHLEQTDLRVVAALTAQTNEAEALAAGDSVWNAWLRAFLSTHRCE